MTTTTIPLIAFSPSHASSRFWSNKCLTSVHETIADDSVFEKRLITIDLTSNESADRTFCVICRAMRTQYFSLIGRAVKVVREHIWPTHAERMSDYVGAVCFSH